MSLEEQRRAGFQAALATRGGELNSFGIELAWEFWNAALDSVVIELPDSEKYYHDTETAENVIRDFRAAIESAGLKVKP